MAEHTPEDPLRATVGDQLREKAETEQRLEAERRASEQRQEQVERRKASEQGTALRHTGGARKVRPPRGRVVGPRTALEAYRPWIVPAAIVAGLWFARRSKLVLLAGVAIGASLVASRWIDGEVEAY